MTKSVETITAEIFVGLREGYSEIRHSVEELKEFLQERTNKGGLCVTVTPTTYIYKEGREEGAIVGIINYPRFIMTRQEIERAAEEIALTCKERFKQERVSIKYQDKMVMIE